MQRGFDPRRFLDLANRLMIDHSYEREPRARTAMCRIYYSAFLVAFQKLQEKGIPIQDDEQIHKAVIETYMEKGLYTIGNSLDQLREKRVDADYHMMASITPDMCKKYATLSERVIQLVEQVKEIH
jgi:uncharacterized protein (UPF0332 family)